MSLTKIFQKTLRFRLLSFQNLVFVVIDNDGQKYIMGDELRPAVYAGSPDGLGTGKDVAARKGMSFEFTYKTSNIYAYTGNIPLTEAI